MKKGKYVSAISEWECPSNPKKVIRRTRGFEYGLIVPLIWSLLVYLLSVIGVNSEVIRIIELDCLLDCPLFQWVDKFFSEDGVAQLLQAIGLSGIVFAWVLNTNEHEECGIQLHAVIRWRAPAFFRFFTVYFILCGLGIYFARAKAIFSSRCALIGVVAGLVHMLYMCSWLIFDLEKRKRVVFTYAYMTCSENLNKEELLYSIAASSAEQSLKNREIYAERVAAIWKKIMPAQIDCYIYNKSMRSGLRVSFETWKRLLHQPDNWYGRVRTAQDIFGHCTQCNGTDIYIGLGFIMYLYSFEAFRKNPTERYRFLYEVFFKDISDGEDIKPYAKLMVLFYYAYRYCVTDDSFLDLPYTIVEMLKLAEEDACLQCIDRLQPLKDAWGYFEKNASALIAAFNICENISLAVAYSTSIRSSDELKWAVKPIIPM